MKRYSFLSKDFIYNALNKLRAAFLAAKDGEEVEEIIKGILTNDERLKVGRRIEIAQMLQYGCTYQEIKDTLKVGTNTIRKIEKSITEYPRCYELINKREATVEEEYGKRAYMKIGSSMQVFKKKEYTGFKRKNVKR